MKYFAKISGISSQLTNNFDKNRSWLVEMMKENSVLTSDLFRTQLQREREETRESILSEGEQQNTFYFLINSNSFFL